MTVFGFDFLKIIFRFFSIDAADEKAGGRAV